LQLVFNHSILGHHGKDIIFPFNYPRRKQAPLFCGKMLGIAKTQSFEPMADRVSWYNPLRVSLNSQTS
jgi:hypothetical protein